MVVLFVILTVGGGMVLANQIVGPNDSWAEYNPELVTSLNLSMYVLSSNGNASQSILLTSISPADDGTTFVSTILTPGFSSFINILTNGADNNMVVSMKSPSGNSQFGALSSESLWFGHGIDSSYWAGIGAITNVGLKVNDASHFMGTNYLVKIFEIILFGGFFLHVFLGIVLQVKNWMARPVRYKVNSKSTTPFLSKYMIYTGVIVLIFIGIHLMNFFFIKIGWVESPVDMLEGGEPDFYTAAEWLFTQPLYSIVYILLIIVLGFHLNHAFQAAFQTLGLEHKKYTPAIKIAGTLYSIFIPFGFILIPIYFLFI